MVPGYQNYGQCQVGLGIGIEKAVCMIFNFKINYTYYQTKFTSDSNIFFCTFYIQPNDNFEDDFNMGALGALTFRGLKIFFT